MKKILFLKDHNDWFWATYLDAATAVSLDLDIITAYFEKKGYCVEIAKFSEFDFSKDYKETYVVYASSEDLFGGSKDYYEDVLLWLEGNGAILIPQFQCFRAHHNKVMMELLKKNFRSEALKTIETIPVRSSSDLDKLSVTYPCVVKTARGAGGGGVYLCQNKKELQKVSEKISRIPSEKTYWWLRLANFKRFLFGQRGRHPMNNVKFIIQTYIPGMTGDNKVLIFGNHYYVLHRMNRENDFRASGSGKFSDISEKELNSVLEFAKLCQKEMDTTLVSLDIGFDGERCHLIEFQFITFGFKAMSLSDHHYILNEEGNFERVEGKVLSETEFCMAVEAAILKRQ